MLRLEEYTSSQLSDDVIVRRVIAGEKELFEILVRRYNQSLFRLIRSYLKKRDEVKDVMQNTYLKAFDKLYQFHFDSSFSTWLMRIGINEALLMLRSIKKERILYSDSFDLTSRTVTRIPDPQMNPEKVVIRGEVLNSVEHAIDMLPEKYRVVFVLKEVDGLENQVIAECLQISEANVKVRLHRAKTLMKEALYQISSPTEVFEFGNTECDSIVGFVLANI